MFAGTKPKSVSVEDLGSLVKQMINGALENTAQVAKLHQAVYEEWYFKKLAELKGSEIQETQENLIQDVEQDNASQKNDLCENNLFFPSNISTNIATENKSTVFKARSQTFNNTVEKSKFNSLTFLRTSNELNKTNNHVSELENIATSNDPKPNIEIIEVWNNNKAQKPKLYKDFKRNFTETGYNAQHNKMKCKDQADINRLAFELWKKEKNIKYKQMIKQQRKEKQEQFQAKLEEIESKRATQTYMRIRKREVSKQKRKLSMEAEAIGQTNIKSFQKETEIKRIINDKVFKEWKRQKDIKLREQKMMNKAYEQYANYCYNQQQQQQHQHQHQQQQQQFGHMDLLQSIDTKFNSWLNQLDWVLHKKYLRERRYLVRSFYCQPAYYGNAADIVYANHL